MLSSLILVLACFMPNSFASSTQISSVSNDQATPWVGYIKDYQEEWVPIVSEIEPVRALAVVTFEPKGMIDSKIYFIIGSPDQLVTRTFVVDANGGKANDIKITTRNDDNLILTVEMPGILSEDGSAFDFEGSTTHTITVEYDHSNFQYKTDATYKKSVSQ